jgi:uncharacterized repeat protein (TIGR03803 family)
MRGKKISIGLTAVLAIAAMALLVTGTRADAQTETVLYSFFYDYGNDGSYPSAGVIFDAAGNLYGTTSYGGSGSCASSSLVIGCGTVFELTPTVSGGWTEKILHSFNNDGADGVGPAAGLVFDARGNLYGTTKYGGTGGSCAAMYLTNFAGCGTVFELTPAADGEWTEGVLHSFNYSAGDGSFPLASLALDAFGNLYGTTSQGGTGSCRGVTGTGPVTGCGTVFEVSRATEGIWREKLLHSFVNDRSDGNHPCSNLIFDAVGNLYGTTLSGGKSELLGTVFELSPGSGERWSERVIHNFEGGNQTPEAGLIFDAAGNLYGTGLYTVFELVHGANGVWTEKTLHDFGTLGTFAYGVIFDPSGNLYGTTNSHLDGSVYELTPEVGGGWGARTLHHFGCCPEDGTEPTLGLILDAAGNLYGTTGGGGTYNNGTVFEITP